MPNLILNLAFGTECLGAVDRFESEQRAIMDEVRNNTDLSVSEAETLFNETLANNTADVYTMIDTMYDEITARIADIITEMEQKIEDQYNELEGNITVADEEIETSLNDGLKELEAEFSDADNLEAIEALKALALRDFASLKLEQPHVPA